MMWMAVASAAMQAIGTITQGNMADKVGTYNANVLNQQANTVMQAAGTREGMLRERNRQALASQRAAMAANGVDPTSGSALVGTEQQMRDADLDALQVRYEGVLQSKGLHDQANLALWEGKAAKKQSRFTAVSSLLSSASSYMGSSGFGKFGPGFSGQQAPAPVSTAVGKPNPYYKG